jgi:hypothetical protein
MMALTERKAQEVLLNVAHIFQSASQLGEALAVAAQARERGDKAELRARELEAKLEEKQQELAKLTTTVLAAEGSANEYLKKLQANREAADAEVTAYMRLLDVRRAEADKEYQANVAEFNALFAESKRRAEQERAEQEAQRRLALENLDNEISAKQVKRHELDRMITELRNKLARV